MIIINEERLKKELNEAQANAASNTEGAMLILAGAGSGKTRTITYKIAHLISFKQIEPRRILAVTFTNKAAREMKARIQKILNDDILLDWMGTFHSICVRILRLCLSKPQIVNALGWKLNSNFSIYDTDDQKKIVRDIVKADMGELFEKSEVKKVLDSISKMKNTVYPIRNSDGTMRLILNTPDKVLAEAEYNDKVRYANYFREYQKKLMESNALDFDDLLLFTVDLFQKLPPIREQFAYRFQYVFVDEYQDTNDLQYALLRLLTENNQNVTVVGDDDQSIYGWRGANIEIIRNFHRDFHPVSIVKLERNYRSTRNIVQGAGSVIAHNERPEEMQKKVYSEEPKGDLISITYVADDRSEAEKIAERISKAGTNQYKETAVFYRTNAQSRQIEKALNKWKIPSVIFGGLRFWERKEIKDILAYLRLVVNKKDDAALYRIINVPPRGIGKTSLELLQQRAIQEESSALEILEHSLESLGKSASKIRPFLEIILKIKEEKNAGETPLPILTEHLIKDIRYKEFLDKEDEVSAEEKKENLDELINAMREFDEENPQATLENFLQEVSLLSDGDKKADVSSSVTLMTIHMAKGLEFKTVHIGGCDENLFPLIRERSIMNDKELKEHLEEERRLFYVGCTRAQKNLYLYHSNNRILNGQFQDSEPSRFLREMDETVVQIQDERPQFENSSWEDSEPFTKSFSGRISRSFTYQRQPFEKKFEERKKIPTSFYASNHSSNASQKTSGNFSRGNFSGNRLGKNFQRALSNQLIEKGSPRIVYDEYSENPFRAGARVFHARYGNGVLIKTSGEGENARAEVLFKDGSVRTLILKFAGLKLVD